MAEDYLPSPEDLELLDTSEPELDAGEAPLSADELAQLRSRAEMVERFYGDPTYARQIITQMAPQLGLQVGAPPAPPPQVPQQPPVTERDLAILRENLGPDLAFLAPQMARAMAAMLEDRTAPLRERQHDAMVQQRTSDYARAAQSMDQEMPGWVQHENDMVGILQFITEAANGGPLMHPRYGSALKLLHTLATGNAQATAQVARRQAEAARSATRPASGARAPQVTLEQQLRKLPSRHAQLAAAFKDTVREMGIEAF
jgi:hypothetical protein